MVLVPFAEAGKRGKVSKLADYRLNGKLGHSATARSITSALGTFETCRMTLRMSANQERPEVSGARSK
jgi:hypothetical protein